MNKRFFPVTEGGDHKVNRKKMGKSIEAHVKREKTIIEQNNFVSVFDKSQETENRPKRVIEDRVFLVDLQELNRVRKSGLIAVELEYSDQVRKAKVAHVGEKVEDVEVADEVVIMLPCGLLLSHQGVEYTVIRRSEIIFVI